MKDNLEKLEGVAEAFGSYTSPKFIQRLASMYARQEPACLIVRGLSVDEKVRPDDLKIENTYPGRAGERHSKEVARLLTEHIGGKTVKTDFGNVIREADPSSPAYIRVESTHTHPEVKINDMFCLVSDGAISRVTFVDDVWNSATDEERKAFLTHGMVTAEGGSILWDPEFVNDHDIFEKLEKMSRLPDREVAKTADIFAQAVRKNAREYYLREGDFIFFAQLKTLRGAPAYPTPESGIEKRWYQSMTYA